MKIPGLSTECTRAVWGAGLALGLFAAASALHADQDREDAFVEANLISIFYHELGHALIDHLGLPVFGQEEDAADVASILLINDQFDEPSAVDIAYDAAFGFLAEAEIAQSEGADVAYWDVHGPDEQRYYTLVCLFVGANPDERNDVAEDLGLPEERFETCEEEFELAQDSWGPVFDDLENEDAEGKLVFEGTRDNLTADVVLAEVSALNDVFSYPDDIPVRVEHCGEANAFYDPSDGSITMCLEFEDHLRDLFAEMAD